MHGNSRLSHLLDLADKGPVLRAALIEELADLLAFWPSDCPQDMRAPCEALLTRAAQEANDSVRADLRVKLRGDPVLTARVLASTDQTKPHDNLGRTLIEMARVGIDVRARMAEALHLSMSRMQEILATDHGLALVCKRLGLSRAAFSSLTMLLGGKGNDMDSYAALDRFDAVTCAAVEDLRATHHGTVINFPREPRDARAS